VAIVVIVVSVVSVVSVVIGFSGSDRTTVEAGVAESLAR
jgi:hypothetical protein